MKKQFLISLLLTISTCSLIAQPGLICDIPIIKNLRPDTITAYVFKGISIPIKKLPGAKPVSNSSFKTRWFTMIWNVQTTSNIEALISNSLHRGYYGKEVDSVHLNLFNEEFLGKVYSQNGKLLMFLYTNKSGSQDVPYVMGIKQGKIKEVISYLELNFHY